MTIGGHLHRELAVDQTIVTSYRCEELCDRYYGSDNKMFVDNCIAVIINE